MSGNRKNIEILVYPGWGFDADTWEIWDAFLKPDYKIEKFNPGYFNPRKKVTFSGLHNRLNIIFAHSFGLLQCPPEQLRDADLLVVFNGFIQFHPVAAQYRRRSKLVVKQMISKLKEKPRRVVKDFHNNCYHPEPVDERIIRDSLNREQLLEDLKRLHSEKLNMEVLRYIPNVCILHGSEDAIVPKQKGRELYNNLPVTGRYYEVREAGHALPFTHTKTCWSFIKPIIENFDQ